MNISYMKIYHHDQFWCINKVVYLFVDLHIQTTFPFIFGGKTPTEDVIIKRKFGYAKSCVVL